MIRIHDFLYECVYYADPGQVPYPYKYPLPQPLDITVVAVVFHDYGDAVSRVIREPKKPGFFATSECVADPAALAEAERFLEKYYMNYSDVWKISMHRASYRYPNAWFLTAFRRAKALELEGRLDPVRSWNFFGKILDRWKESGPTFNPVDAMYDENMRKIAPKNKVDAKLEKMISGIDNI